MKINTRRTMMWLLALSLGAAVPISFASEPASAGRQNEIYRSFRAHLHMGKTFEAAKLFTAAEFAITPEAAAEEYFRIKLYRTDEAWAAEIRKRIRGALELRAMGGEELKHLMVNENYASFSYTKTIAEAVPDENGYVRFEGAPRETAHLIADAVFTDVPEIEILQIVIHSPGPEGKFRAEKFDFMKQT